MKPSMIATALLILGANLTGGCGENADSTSVILYIESEGQDIGASTTDIDIITGTNLDIRSTHWVAFGTMQRSDNPWDIYDTQNGALKPVGGVTIAFQAQLNDFNVDEFGNVPDGVLPEDYAKPIILIDSGGKEMGSQFEAKTDSIGKYWLGVSILMNACRHFTLPVYARVMNQTAIIQVTTTADADFDPETMCGSN